MNSNDTQIKHSQTDEKQVNFVVEHNISSTSKTHSGIRERQFGGYWLWLPKISITKKKRLTEMLIKTNPSHSFTHIIELIANKEKWFLRIIFIFHGMFLY